MLFEIILAANYLDIKSLLYVSPCLIGFWESSLIYILYSAVMSVVKLSLT